MFCHISDSILVKSACRNDVVKTYRSFLAIEKFSETPLNVKWCPARTWDFTRGTLSDFYVMVVYPYPPLFGSKMVCSLQACKTHEQGFHIELCDKI